MTNSRVGQARIIEGITRNQLDIDYCNSITKQLEESANRGFKRQATKEQPESTKRALEAQAKRDPKDDLDYLLRPMPDCVAKTDAKTLTDLVGTRSVEVEQVLLHKSTQASRNQLGESKESSISPEKRQKGIEAFTYSRPADLTLDQIKKLTKLQEIVNTPFEPEEEAKPVNTFEKLLFPVAFVCRHTLNIVFAPFKILDDWMFK